MVSVQQRDRESRGQKRDLHDQNLIVAEQLNDWKTLLCMMIMLVFAAIILSWRILYPADINTITFICLGTPHTLLLKWSNGSLWCTNMNEISYCEST